MIKDYLRYLYASHNRHGIHSPFIYEFNEQVLNYRPGPEELAIVNSYRKFLKANLLKLKVEDLGSGSYKIKTDLRAVKDIYQTAGTNRRMGEVLYRIIKYYNHRNILELGSCLGMGTAYMQAAIETREGAQIHTIEGSHALASFTKGNFRNYFPDHSVNFIEGNFDKVLPELLQSIPTIGLALIDGNHTYMATISYFNLLLEKINQDSILIFDDIYWSKGMKQAWNEIRLHPRVSCSVDVFRWGIVFFRKEMQKEHFILRFNGFLKAHIS